MDGESFDSLGFLFLIYKGLTQIYGGIVCKRKARAKTKEKSRNCLIAVIISQIIIVSGAVAYFLIKTCKYMKKIIYYI